MEDWGAVRDRLEQAYTMSSMEHVQVRKADIRAALERISRLEESEKAASDCYAAAEADVERLEELILDWESADVVARDLSEVDLYQEARRIRAQREDREDAADAVQTKALWESRTDSTGSDKGFVKITDVQLRAQRKEGA
jgi:hypothetical protein